MGRGNNKVDLTHFHWQHGEPRLLEALKNLNGLTSKNFDFVTPAVAYWVISITP